MNKLFKDLVVGSIIVEPNTNDEYIVTGLGEGEVYIKLKDSNEDPVDIPEEEYNILISKAPITSLDTVPKGDTKDFETNIEKGGKRKRKTKKSKKSKKTKKSRSRRHRKTRK